MKTKNKTILIGLFLFGAILLAPGGANAAVNTTLYIQGPGGTVLVNTSLVVPQSCTVAESGGGTPTFLGHKAICALQAAKDIGVITDFQVTDWGFGFSLDSVNGIANAGDWSELWQLWLNGIAADVGIQGIVLSGGDAFQLTYGPWPTEIIQGVASEKAKGGPVVLDVFPRKVNVENAVSFLVANQRQDGSFGHPLFTDWVAVALGAYEGKSATALAAKESLKDWMAKNPVPEGSIITDYERRAMALMSLGTNPFQGAGQNVIEPILEDFDGQQFASPDLVNDDIFATLVLLKAGYEANVTPLLETLPFILSWQRGNGSFGSVDLTAAAVQVLSLFPESKERNTALGKARDYLVLQQESTGGFGNVYSTSWVLQAIASLNEDGNAWAMEVDRRTPEHFLALHQAQDGGLLGGESGENRIWATSYAIPGVLQKPWGDILIAFEKPLLPEPQAKERTPGELTQQELDALSASLKAAAQRIASFESGVVALIETAEKLKAIEKEVSRIAQEVEALKPQVASLYTAYLAQLQQPEKEVLAEQPTEELPPSDLLSEEIITLQKETLGGKGEDLLAAQASGTAEKSFFSDRPGQIVLAVGIGIALFLVLGGWKMLETALQRRPVV